MSTDKPPQNYDDLKEALDKLFDRWKKAVSPCFGDNLIIDGALPRYYQQELKILFLAREMHTTAGLKKSPEKRNIVEFVNAFLSGLYRNDPKPSTEAYAVKTLTSGKNKNILPCWRLAAHIAYGLLQLQGLNPEIWGQASSIKDIQESYKNKEFSFAIIEVSKYNNIVGAHAPKTSGMFEQFAYESVGFTREEIDIINPDLIISWNLRDAFKKDRDGKKNNGNCFLKELTGSSSFEEPSEDIRIWTYKEIPLIDTWHFTAHKNNIECFYRPISEAVDVQKLIAEKNDQDKKEQ